MTALSVALSAPTLSPVMTMLGELTTKRGAEIDAWCRERAAKGTALPYASVDLRHSGEKLAPVDTNIFPAGFNNLSENGRVLAAQAFARYLSTSWPAARRVLIVPENHTRNLGYLDNLATLAGLLRDAGAEVAIGRFDLPDAEHFEFTSSRRQAESAVALRRDGDRLMTADGFDPDLILLNNDLTAGIPPLLDGVAQPVVPPVGLGWWRRRKSAHFAAYDRLAREFAGDFDVDPWRLTTGFRHCGTINFREKSGLQCVALGIEAVLHSMREKYREHGITREPYVFVKADSGTYGMGIMTATSGEDALNLNKKTRNKMDVVKEGAQVTEVVIQEGIPTIDTVGGSAAEPVVYLVDAEAAGSVWRVNAERSDENNLNAAGMQFLPTGELPDPAHALVGRLAALAAGREEVGMS